ncbi:MAG: PRC-barrel domain-containing protein [Peptococcaceae bacterium]|nr:PRC-barrel domain-containing protein [Peptococcaceae bacterium]
MKTTQEIMGLRIISIADGTELGMVKDIVLNSTSGTLDYVIASQVSDYLGARIIAFQDVLGVGEFAMTVPNLEVVQDVAHNSAAQELIKLNVRVIGSKVLTKKGQLIGEVKELLIDEESSKISGCFFENTNGDRLQVTASSVITYGKDLLIIDGLPNGAKSIETTKKPNVSSAVEPTPENEGEFNAFEKRQLQYFVGKAVEIEVTLDNGDVLPAGQTITADDVSKMTSRNTLMNITAQLQKQ